MLELVEQWVASESNDPVWRLLADRLHVSGRARAVYLAWIIGILTMLVLPALTGFLFPRPGIVGALQDWPTFFINFGTAALIYVYYIVDQPDMIRNLIQGLKTMPVQTNDRETSEMVVGQASARLASKAWFFLATLIAVAGALVWARDVQGHDIQTYYSYPAVVFAVNILRVALPLYMIVIMLVRHAVVTWASLVFFRQYKPDIHVLHPDRCGGLAFLGRFSLRGAYLLAIVALDISLLILHNVDIVGVSAMSDRYVVGAILAYGLLAPLAFFAPLASAHRGMSQAKVDAEKLISDEANRLYKSIQVDLGHGRLDATAIAQLDDLHRLSKMTADFPVWPLDLGTIGRFATIVLIPLIPALISSLLDMMGRLTWP